MKMMLPVLSLLLALPAQAQQFTAPPGHRDKVRYVVTRLYVSHQCDKRLGKPEMYENAKTLFTRALVDAGATIAFIDARIEQLSAIPIDIGSNPSLFSADICGSLERSLQAQVDEPSG